MTRRSEPAQAGGPGALGHAAIALAILAAGLLLEGHPVDASVGPRVLAVEPDHPEPARALPSVETMLRDLAGRD
ncbi:hypothetical protein OPKNFCMD_3909 [Methylobacterium crusticola]|uniref:Uncharacterized protein n=1 Tax=Methylobacterium crusticola TaxID=1697972 RepID=A0ABQ4R325_9HYPH|nr:hypothetical protein [Methylobacterium crusticola]GJD51157.1 hypothetical protein OPKNFCMD_3909 [Methylobacterium crusticola]